MGTVGAFAVSTHARSGGTDCSGGTTIGTEIGGAALDRSGETTLGTATVFVQVGLEVGGGFVGCVGLLTQAAVKSSRPMDADKSFS